MALGPASGTELLVIILLTLLGLFLGVNVDVSGLKHCICAV